MDIIFSSILITIFFSSYYVFGLSYYITIFIMNLCITFTIFKYYPLASGHSAVIVYLFFLINNIILHLSSIPYFLRKKNTVLYFAPPFIIFILQVLLNFSMSSSIKKSITVSILMFISFFPFHIIYYMKNRGIFNRNNS